MFMHLRRLEKNMHQTEQTATPPQRAGYCAPRRNGSKEDPQGEAFRAILPGRVPRGSPREAFLADTLSVPLGGRILQQIPSPTF